MAASSVHSTVRFCPKLKGCHDPSALSLPNNHRPKDLIEGRRMGWGTANLTSEAGALQPKVSQNPIANQAKLSSTL
ncbi:hypothetical protein FVEN_g12739 [Fusarium venenatum]|uniref:Uncharacterized protein n=1 Tax=Fusarium venenatum TaxID=56646 RepID=A0A2L2TK96_9HYPO|nr:uncharacterized protein FVRRES_13498 [Fusarium venenatum]KAG8358397.1 hypothetical protein FVEN_g12739 [Fusarium venenatum]CEI41266.1 unnamed protein product [Fusarium venenatum]